MSKSIEEIVESIKSINDPVEKLLKFEQFQTHPNTTIGQIRKVHQELSKEILEAVQSQEYKAFREKQAELKKEEERLKREEEGIHELSDLSQLIKDGTIGVDTLVFVYHIGLDTGMISHREIKDRGHLGALRCVSEDDREPSGIPFGIVHEITDKKVTVMGLTSPHVDYSLLTWSIDLSHPHLDKFRVQILEGDETW